MGIENGKAHGLQEAKGGHIHLFFPGQSSIPTFTHPDNHGLPIHYPEAVLPSAVEWLRFESSPLPPTTGQFGESYLACFLNCTISWDCSQE